MSVKLDNLQNHIKLYRKYVKSYKIICFIFLQASEAFSEHSRTFEHLWWGFFSAKESTATVVNYSYRKPPS